MDTWFKPGQGKKILEIFSGNIGENEVTYALTSCKGMLGNIFSMIWKNKDKKLPQEWGQRRRNWSLAMGRGSGRILMTWFELLNIIVLSNRPPATFPTFVGGGNGVWKLVSISFLLFVTKADFSVQISLYCRGCSQPPLKISIPYSCFSLHPLICYSFLFFLVFFCRRDRHWMYSDCYWLCPLTRMWAP